MKKLLFTFFAAAVLLTSAYSYNPPAGGEDLNLIASPANLSGANSVTGGALFDAGADSIIVNPALTASEQRVNLTAGYTFLYSSEDLNEKQIGGSFQTGILIPFKLYIFSGYMNGTFAPFGEMHLGNSLNFKAGLSKEITDKLTVGTNLNTGIFWGAGTLFYPGMIDRLHELLGGDFYVLPSSVHELILIAVDDQDPQQLVDLVRSANRSVVKDNEILADDLYICESGELHRVSFGGVIPACGDVLC